MGPQIDENGTGAKSFSKQSSSGLGEDQWSIVLKEEELREPKPAVERLTILGIGLALFAMAIIWPPLILLVTYVASFLFPYSFRDNDDAMSRRQLLDNFEKEDRVSDCLREIPDDVHMETGYWTNSR